MAIVSQQCTGRRLRLVALLLLCFQCDSVFSSQKRADVSPHPTVTRPELVRTALEKDSDIFYFGLGSNMLRSKLENRSICGTKIHVKSMEPALVKNYRLAFNMRGFPPLEPGMGSIEPVNTNKEQDDNEPPSSKPLSAYKEKECHGALVRLSAQDYEKVMRSEGVGSGRPDQGYEEVVVSAVPYGSTRAVPAVALRAREHVRLPHDPAPSQRYMDILQKGANELGLAPCYQEFLQEHPVAEASPLMRKIAVCNLVFTAKLSFQWKIRMVSKIQSWLLWRVYVRPTANLLVRMLSELATVAILLPGAIPGSLLLMYMRYNNSMSSMMKTMVDSHW